MNNFIPHKVTLAVLVSILVCGIASLRSGPLLAQSVQLPLDTRLPYEGSKFYTGGPHSGDICQQLDISSASGIDFAGGTFEVLAIADGQYLGQGETTASGLQAGKYVLIQHSTGIQSMYWHLASFAPEILALTPGQSIPRGFPIGLSGQSGNQPALHLHLELRTGARADDPYSGHRVSWDGQTIDGWTIWMFRWPGDPSTGISYRGSAVMGASRTQSITNVTCGQTIADAIVSATYPNQTIASNDLDSNTGFANFSNAPTCQAVDCKLLVSSNTRNTNLPTGGNPVDVFLLVDLSDSFADDLPVFQAQAPAIISTLKDSFPNIRFGVGSFEDYPIPPFGDAGSGDAAYRRNIDLTFDTAAVEAVISGLFTRVGTDTPESQLPALFQAANGKGQDLSGVGFPGASIPAGQQANFRDGATKLFLLWTDAPFHLPGDPGAIPYPGPSFDETVAAILALDPPQVIGISSGGGGLADLQAMAVATGALAPTGGTDCNNDGIIDVLAGDPLVCSIGASGEGIAEAIIALIEAAASTFIIDSTLGWQTTSLNVTAGQQLSFSASGSWTVDHLNFSFVGPDGYPPEVDNTIFQGCKLDPTLPYGKLLAKVGDDPSFQVIGSGGTLTAGRDGLVAFRIHDADGCLGDNAGTVTVTVVDVNKPVFVYPIDGQILAYGGSYLFLVDPIPTAQGFLWSFFQNGVLVWENLRDEGALSSNEYGIHPETTAHSKFVPGSVEVWVRASIDGQYTDAAIITIYLQ